MNFGSHSFLGGAGEENRMQTVETNLWEVQLGDGQLDVMSLEQLDDAFQAGHITEQTLVKECGTKLWSTLAVVAGLESADPDPVPMSSMPNSMAPVMSEISPMSATFSAPRFAPISSPELDYEYGAPAFKSGKKKFVVMGVAAAAIAAVVGIIVVSASSSGGAEASSTAAAPPALAPMPLPVAASPKVDPAPTDRLSDDQKHALLDADKKRVDPRKTRAKGESAAPPSRGSAKRVSTGNVFHKGGNQFDPLNSNL
jgi:hypothetical protein